ncbi:hypothetical protein [Aequorivita marina]|uniref:hypothetical protein n=1 Tax=Aequorivita marina TaxID=3073654 RepID=UPI0028758EFB|nr:hypothetical protein [Aequorivita sp. S2608]MDS1298233.1 hypothetical protein [Aequorivita sp. S2608]
MKSLKIIILRLALLLVALPMLSQEVDDTAKLSYRAFSISPVGFYVGSDAGYAFNADIGFVYQGNIFALDFGAGSALSVFGPGDDYIQANILYGRSFKLNKTIFTDVFIGAGYFHFNTYGVIDTSTRRRGEIDKKTLGFPLGAKLQFRLGPRYSMGVRIGTNINSAESIGTLGLLLQWNSKKD